jgi:hypothetical protein
MGQIAGLRFFHNQTLGWDETKLFIPKIPSSVSGKKLAYYRAHFREPFKKTA